MRDHEKIRETIGTTLSLMGLCSLVFMALSMLFCRPLLTLMNTPAEALGQSYDYMMVTALGMPFIFGYNAVCGILRGMGESKRRWSSSPSRPPPTSFWTCSLWRCWA